MTTKLYEALVAHYTGVKATPTKWQITEGLSTSRSYSTLKVYDVSARIGCRIVLPVYGEEDAMRKAWVSISHHAYGEFRDDLMAIREALYDADLDKAQGCLEKLHNKMFTL